MISFMLSVSIHKAQCWSVAEYHCFVTFLLKVFCLIVDTHSFSQPLDRFTMESKTVEQSILSN